ncbi:AMP-binding protein [Iamia sp. SCSIO 61187]|uniref:AMP-binding protein n=1 Tax=Iamia sp. SCSIO 61187 TaxID=2722752 RepID=UPI001C62D65E|nr:AMP-binding protein [Iamia sp. SCSIO 61187]QYG93000.1 AMP-binding protein [Iamia sp. SCSIO 61187]
MSGLNLAAAQHAIAAAVPDRPALIWRGTTWTWAEVAHRTACLARVLRAHDIGLREAPAGEGWESPHDHVALVLLNGNEYLEGMVGAWRARAAAVNINWRYTAPEMAEVLADARAAAVVYHGRYAEVVGEALALLPEQPRLLLRVADGTPGSLLPGALPYEDALATAIPLAPDPAWSGDDRYIVYTGGTTGRPKGVLWRQDDFAATCLGVRGTPQDLAARAAARGPLRTLPAAPFMHGAAHWNALSAWLAGGTVVVQDVVDRYDPADVIATCVREQATALLIVGDAFARPLVEELRARPASLPLRHLLTGGTILSAPVKQALIELIPGVRIVDVLGSSETGRQAVTSSDERAAATSGTFRPEETTVIVSEDRTRVLSPAEDDIGWMAQAGRVPLGYLNDPEKSEATFPTIDGVRYSVAGDRARWRPDGTLELLGREAVVINTGGEKVYAEEVEMALAHHPGVADCLVVGRPHERFGSEIVAVVAPRPGATVDVEGLRATAADHLAAYKLPRAVVLVDAISRSPSGKPDYAWAREQAVSTARRGRSSRRGR